MKYYLLGKSGLRVSDLAFGATGYHGEALDSTQERLLCDLDVCAITRQSFYCLRARSCGRAPWVAVVPHGRS
jgi:hypothetical protein